MKYTTLTILFLFVINCSHANEEKAWVPIGEAKLSILFWDIYEARLFNDTGVFIGVTPPLQLQLTYLIDIEGDELANETKKQWQKMGIYKESDEQWLGELKLIFPDISENDTLTFTFELDNGASLTFNNVLIHQFEPSPQVGKFLAIWLSEKSTHPKVRDKLVGQIRR